MRPQHVGNLKVTLVGAFSGTPKETSSACIR